MANFWLGPIASGRGYRLFGSDEIGSTSTEAARAAESGDAGEVWFASLKQTAGRGRRGRIEEMTPMGNATTIKAMVPLSEMFGYATDLRSMTQGRADFTMQFDRYEEVPQSIASEIIDARG